MKDILKESPAIAGLSPFFSGKKVDNGPSENAIVEFTAMLNEGLENEEFELFYQPKIDIKQNRVIGMEALIRWNQATKGFSGPQEFIPMAEETGQIIELGRWVMAESCAFMADITKAGIEGLKVSVNVSAHQLAEKGFSDSVKKILDETGVDPKTLEIEITESTILNDIETVVANLMEFRRLGLEITIDDFGTGYSAISYLQKLPIDRIKIDKSFVSNMTNQEGRSIVSAIIALAFNLKLDVIAEGVETKEELKILEYLSCSKIQGYYFCQPLRHDEFIRFVGEYNSTK